MTERPLTIREAAARLNCPLDTLRYWRAQHTGPKSFRMGKRVFYMPADLDAWIEKCQPSQRPVVLDRQARAAENEWKRCILFLQERGFTEAAEALRTLPAADGDCRLRDWLAANGQMLQEADTP